MYCLWWDPFSGESEAQRQQAIGPALIGVLPAVQLIKGKRAWEEICSYCWRIWHACHTGCCSRGCSATVNFSCCYICNICTLPWNIKSLQVRTRVICRSLWSETSVLKLKVFFNRFHFILLLFLCPSSIWSKESIFYRIQAKCFICLTIYLLMA